MALKKKSRRQLDAQASKWNEKHPIGTKVNFHPLIGRPESRPGVTRSAATVLSGHTAVVWLEGEAGCVALDALEIPKETGK